MNSAAYSVGSSLGFVLAAQLAALAPQSVSGYRNAIWLMAALIAVGFVVSMVIGGRVNVSDQKV